jgi:hypothetical protein
MYLVSSTSRLDRPTGGTMTALRLLPELEESLRAIPGIRAASVVTGPDARPTEVHVLAQPGKPAKQVVRDVQSVAMAQFDLDIDHRIVSVVQIADESAVEVGDTTEVAEAEEPSAIEPPRPALTSITVKSSEGESEVSVALAIGGSVYAGHATGPGAPIHRARIVAGATLAAMTELLGIPAQIESAQLLEIGLREVAVTVLTLTIPRLGEQILCGSALVRGDEEDAVARSVLAAVNRRLAG